MKHSFTSVKIKLRPSTIDGQPGSVIYQVTRHRVVRSITTDYKLFPSEWDAETSQVIVPVGVRHAACQSIAQRIEWDMQRIRRIVASLDNRADDYASDDVVKEFRRQGDECSLFNYMEAIINRMKQLGQSGTSRNYRSTLNSFRRFRNEADLSIDELTPQLAADYQAWLSVNGSQPNTISFYMRILRAVYRRAVEENLVVDAKPFSKVYTGVEKTAKRAITVCDIQRIKDLDLSLTPHLEFPRDMFLFLFYCRGMSFVDAAYLKKTDVVSDAIRYRRQKTNQPIEVAIAPEIRQIIKRYSNQDSPYLLPIIVNPGVDERRQYETALRRVNYSLKKIGELADVKANLTTYVTRHAWASIAKQIGIPTSTISEALGHDSIATTEIYLASIGTEAIDRSNRMILKLLK